MNLYARNSKIPGKTIDNHPPCPAWLLAMLKKNGDIKDYVSQKKFDFIVNGVKVCSHIADFFVQQNSGEWEVQETKGRMTAVFALKYKLFLACFPGFPFFGVGAGLHEHSFQFRGHAVSFFHEFLRVVVAFRYCY